MFRWGWVDGKLFSGWTELMFIRLEWVDVYWVGFGWVGQLVGLGSVNRVFCTPLVHISRQVSV